MNKSKTKLKHSRNQFNKFQSYAMDIQKNRFIPKDKKKHRTQKPSQDKDRNDKDRKNNHIYLKEQSIKNKDTQKRKYSSSASRNPKRPLTSYNKFAEKSSMHRPKSSKNLRSNSKQNEKNQNKKQKVIMNPFGAIPMNKNQMNKLFDKKKKKKELKKKLKSQKIDQQQIVYKKNKFIITKDDDFEVNQKQNIDKPDLDDFITKVPKNQEDFNQVIKQPQLIPADPKQTYYVSQIVKGFMIQEGMAMARDHLITSMQMLQFLKNIRKPQQKQINKVQLQKKDIYKGKKTIVFDLDETLIHCNERTDLPCDAILPITFPTGQVINAGINVRPYAYQVIKKLYLDYELIIFTASHSCYANKVIDFIDPQRKYFSHRLFRDNCWQTPQGSMFQLGLYIKDLRVISNRQLSQMILIDNAIYSYYFQLDNGVPIIPYYEGKKDAELLSLLPYVTKIDNYKDVRDHNKEILKIQKYLQYDDPISLISQLYPDQIEFQQSLLNQQ